MRKKNLKQPNSESGKAEPFKEFRHPSSIEDMFLKEEFIDNSLRKKTKKVKISRNKFLKMDF